MRGSWERDQTQDYSWHSVLSLLWLRTFLTNIASAHGHISELDMSGRPAMASRSLSATLDQYVSALKNYQQEKTAALDIIEDCLMVIDDRAVEIMRQSSQSAPAIVHEMANRQMSRALRPSPLLSATPWLANCNDDEIRELIESTVDNVSAIQALWASLIQKTGQTD